MSPQECRVFTWTGVDEGLDGDRETQEGRGGLTLVKVRDTCLLPHVVTQATSAHTSSWRTDCEEAVATATAPVAMEIAMCERSVSRTQTEGSGPNHITSHPSRDKGRRWER